MKKMYYFEFLCLEDNLIAMEYEEIWREKVDIVYLMFIGPCVIVIVEE